jgi:methionyl-tRNA formyltransferase
VRVLVLGPDSPVVEGLRSAGEDVERTENRVSAPQVHRFDFVVSYGYRHIVNPEVIEGLRGRIVNLHVSLLPWNRGADPNFWSFFDDTPKGVTIHQMDNGVDTGPIIAQREVRFTGRETLASSYSRLRSELEQLFAESWPSIRHGTAPSHPQEPGGSYHGLADRAPLEELPDGWDTPVEEVERLGRIRRCNKPAG